MNQECHFENDMVVRSEQFQLVPEYAMLQKIFKAQQREVLGGEKRAFNEAYRGLSSYNAASTVRVAPDSGTEYAMLQIFIGGTYYLRRPWKMLDKSKEIMDLKAAWNVDLLKKLQEKCGECFPNQETFRDYFE